MPESAGFVSSVKAVPQQLAGYMGAIVRLAVDETPRFELDILP